MSRPRGRPEGHQLSPQSRARIGAGVRNTAERKRAALRDKDMTALREDIAALREELRELTTFVKLAFSEMAETAEANQETLTSVVRHQRKVHEAIEQLSGGIAGVADAVTKLLGHLPRVNGRSQN